MGIMENKMEITVVYWGSIGIMEKKMETTIVYRGYYSILGYYYIHHLCLQSTATGGRRALAWSTHNRLCCTSRLLITSHDLPNPDGCVPVPRSLNTLVGARCKV